MVTKHTSSVVPVEFSGEFIERKIHVIRGRKVMLDSDLAELYQVPTKRLNEAVKRNQDRFPTDFMFHLSQEEAMMRSQIATASKRNIQSRPYAFTEHGVAMLSSVLRSDRAVKMNIYIVRAFIALRENLVKETRVSKKLKRLDDKITHHKHRLDSLSSVVKQIINPPLKPKRRIGFTTDNKDI